MAISAHFSASDVMLDVSVKNKRDLLEVLAAKAASRLARSTEEIVDALQSREDLGSTALGKGVGLPHAELEGAVSPTMIFARLRRPIEFDARDAEPVDLVFLVLWPAAATKGLIEAISEICRTLRDPEVLRRLRMAETPDEVAQFMRTPATWETTRSPPAREDE
jgi:PTS system nitrogen regulatory IIA component